ncbi:membrane progestin receptor gamma isoform X1 [Gopherus evgoodei]|uniref:membrane progestin receptor gamma isoform X1 n=1 Tax=Gopherus evgoodei TaxID=1825980 RepID=UPI0011CF4EC5|nr:membrane progestin receptor gamma isoform X1 [Gopherus evgoodei]
MKTTQESVSKEVKILTSIPSQNQPRLTLHTMLSWKLPRQLSINQVPQVFREQGILFGYRHPRSSAADCLLSVFQMTNETLNIWTHFLPAWYFLWKLFALAYSLDVWNDTYAWPFLAYMLTCCIYPFTSSCAHTFSTMSIQVLLLLIQRMFSQKNGSIALSITVMYPLLCLTRSLALVFPATPGEAGCLHCFLPENFLLLPISFSPTEAVSVQQSHLKSSHFRFLHGSRIKTGQMLGAPYLHYNSDVTERFPEIKQPRLSKTLRTLAFAYPYLFDSTPLFYRLYLCTGESCMESVIPVHYKHCVFAFLTCFIFAAHLPERLAPGRFDYIGHSHQLFHVCGIIGTHFQMEAIFIDMNARRDWLLAFSPLLSFSQTAGSIGISIIMSLTIIAAFSWALYSRPKSSRKEKLHRH